MKKKQPQKKQPQPKPATQSTNISSQKNIASSYKVIPPIIIAVFAFVLYAQSIQHNYALDDSAVVQENSVTTQCRRLLQFRRYLQIKRGYYERKPVYSEGGVARIQAVIAG
jgi:hypothetical protein